MLRYLNQMKTTRNTTAKLAILEILNQSEVALSHSEIQKKTEGLCDRVTIYRVLDRLIKEDLIHKIVTPEGIIKYAICHHSHPNNFHHLHNHIHFNCEKCHSVTCLESIVPTYIIPENYMVNQVNFTLTGLCPNCINL